MSVTSVGGDDRRRVAHRTGIDIGLGDEVDRLTPPAHQRRANAAIVAVNGTRTRHNRPSPPPRESVTSKSFNVVFPVLATNQLDRPTRSPTPTGASGDTNDLTICTTGSWVERHVAVSGVGHLVALGCGARSRRRVDDRRSSASSRPGRPSTTPCTRSHSPGANVAGWAGTQVNSTVQQRVDDSDVGERHVAGVGRRHRVTDGRRAQ